MYLSTVRTKTELTKIINIKGTEIGGSGGIGISCMSISVFGPEPSICSVINLLKNTSEKNSIEINETKIIKYLIINLFMKYRFVFIIGSFPQNIRNQSLP